MVGLENLISSTEIRIIVSVLILLLAIGLVYLVRKLQDLLSRHINLVIADIFISIAILALVVISTILITDIWGQTDNLLNQLALLNIENKLSQIIVTIVILISIQILISVISRLLEDLTQKNNAITKHQREVSYRVSQLILWSLGLIIILGVWRINISGLLIGAGFLGIVVGLAARKTLGSLLAGFTLMFSRPFEIGDWIEVSEKQGKVTDITMMNTRIKSFDGEYIIIPNDVISNQIVTNKSRDGKLRIEINVGIDYDSNIEKVQEISLNTAKELAKKEKYIIKKPRPRILARRFNDSSIMLSIFLWIDNPSLEKVNKTRHKLISNIKEKFDKEDIKIPFPQRELSGRKESGGLQISDKTKNEGESKN